MRGQAADVGKILPGNLEDFCYTACMKQLLFILLAVWFGGSVLAGEPLSSSPSPSGSLRLDTTFLRQYAETRGFMLGRPTKPKFTPDGKHLLFLRAEGPKTPKLWLFEFEVATRKTRELLSPEALLKGAEENLSPEEKARRERMRVSVGGFADYQLSPDGTQVLVMLSGKLYVFDRASAKARELATGEGSIVDPKWSPDGKMISFVKDQDVWIFDLTSGKAQAVTIGGTPTVTHGLAEFVAQEEMGRFSGYWWSPDSKKIAYTEADHTGVESWWIADPFRPERPPQLQFYPRPGKKNVAVRLGIIPVAGGKTTWVTFENTEYLAAVKWDKKGGLTAQVQDRKQQNSKLLRIDPAGGHTTVLLEETDSRWLNLHQEFPDWIDEHRFVWLSDISGDQRLQIVDTRKTDANRVQAISPAGLQISTLVELGRSKPETQTVIPVVQGTTDGLSMEPWMIIPERIHAHRLSTARSPGLTSLITTADLSQRVVTITTPQRMPESRYESESIKVVLPSIAAEPPFTPTVQLEKVGEYWTAVVRPRNFEPLKKYPVIVDVYGGPHHSHVQPAMRNWLVPQWLADQGFIVVAIDNRGIPGRGRDWERAIYQKFGSLPLEDQVKGLQLLGKKLPELDLTRVGIVGWSFGGYMAANAVLRRPDVFHAAVAGAPVTDWEDYDTHYTERYLGLLPESKMAYDDASLIPLAKNLARPLLLVHGTADDNVYYRHSLKLADALFRAGRDFDSLPLPGLTHMYTADPQVTERLWERTVRFFHRHLGLPR
jgi:dipeptidyl-peptidase-4